MAFNQIKNVDKLGVVASVVGNERTLAAQAKARAESRARVANAPLKSKLGTQCVPLGDVWTQELVRLGFVGGE